jgi:hypothetical protein
LAQLGVQRHGIGAALVPPLVQMVLLRVEQAVAAGVGQQRLDILGIGEAAHGLRVQAEAAADFGPADTVGQQLLDLGVASDRQVGEAMLVPAAHRRGRRSAGRTPGIRRPSPARDEHLTRQRFDVQHLTGGQLRKDKTADGVIMHRDMIT